MKMNIRILALSACLSMPFQLVSADIASDFEAGLSIADVLEKAIKEGMGIETAVAKMVALHPEFVTIIVKAAVKAAPPEQAGKIVAAATSAAPQFADAIASSAIESGANPTVVTAATAAGKPQPSVEQAPAPTLRAAPAPRPAPVPTVPATAVSPS